jgi:peptide/nickel transport system substrate-binding protein
MIGAIALGLAGALAFSGCSGGANDTGDGGGKTLTIAESSTTTSIDYSVGEGTTMLKELAGVTETLVNVDQNLKLVPNLATSWKRTDAKTWRFTLRTGVQFHDGTKFNAEAVKWCLEYGLSKSRNPQLSGLLPVTSITAVDDSTVDFHTSVASGDLPEILSNALTGIYAKSSLDKSGKFTTAVGTGYFKQKSFDVSTGRYESVVFDHYWKKIASNITHRVIIGKPDPGTRSLAVQNGEADIASDAPFADLNSPKIPKGISSKLVANPRTYFLQFNLKHPQFKDIRVRHAMAYAIDKNQLVNGALLGVGQVAKGVQPESMPWTNNDVPNYAYNVAKAKQLFAEAGYAPGPDGHLQKDGKPLTVDLVTYTLRPGMALIAQAIQGYLEKIGVKTSIEVLELSTLEQRTTAGTYDLNLASGATAYVPSPCYYMDANYHSTSSTAIKSGYVDKTLDGVITRCNAEDNLATKTALSKQAQKIGQDDAAIYTVADYASVFIINDRLKGLTFNPAAHDYIVPYTTDLS